MIFLRNNKEIGCLQTITNKPFLETPVFPLYMTILLILLSSCSNAYSWSWNDSIPLINEEKLIYRNSIYHVSTEYERCSTGEIHSLSKQDNLVSLNWTQANSNAPWSPRNSHTALSFDNKLWIFGGTSPDIFILNDVWNSSDGIYWTQVTDNATWYPRCDHASLVFDDKMWILGGAGPIAWNDVWYSTDGVYWTQATDNAAWSPRGALNACVFDNKMWVLAGIDDGSDVFRKHDVWYSSDGVNWTCATNDPEWGILDGFSAVAFQDKMWIMAGYNITYGYTVGDVWSSTDGAQWTYEGDCGWGLGHVAVAAGGAMWLMGGGYHGYPMYNVWCSQDGANWMDAGIAGWAPRGSFASVTFDGKIWVLGGSGYSESKNDVWYAEVFNAHFYGAPVTDTVPLTVQFTDESISVLETITSWLWDFGDGTTSTEQHPVHTYDLRGLYDVSLTVTSASNTDTETKTGYIHVTGVEHPYHSADRDQDHKISLSELLRMIQFYNLDGLHCAPGTEDGYAPGLSRRSETKPDTAPDKGFNSFPSCTWERTCLQSCALKKTTSAPGGMTADLSRRHVLRSSESEGGSSVTIETKTDCELHDSDYNPPDWTINMSELLRIIQLFRSPGYYPCIDGEDGFCVD